MVSFRNLFRSNKDGQSASSKVDADRADTESTFFDEDSSGGNGQETNSAEPTKRAIHRSIEETEESWGAQNRSNSSSGATSRPVKSGETSSSRPIRSNKYVSSSNDRSVPQQGLENSLNSAIIADNSSNSNSLTKRSRIRSKSSSRHKRVLDFIADDDRPLPPANLEKSISSFDAGYHVNSALSLTRNPKQVTATNISSSKHKRVSSRPTTDDDDDNCLSLGASHNISDLSVANNSEDALFEALYEMDVNDEDEVDVAYPSSSNKPAHSVKEGSIRKSRKSVIDNNYKEGSVRSARGGGETNKESKRKFQKEGSSNSIDEKGSKRKSPKSLIDTTEDSRHKSRSKSRGRSKSKTRKLEKEEPKYRSRSTGRSKSELRKLEKEESKNRLAKKEVSKRKSRSIASDKNHSASPTRWSNGDFANNSLEGSMLSSARTRNRSSSASPASIRPPLYPPDEVDDHDDIQSQTSEVETPRKSKGQSKSAHERKSFKIDKIEGLNHEVEQLKQEVSEAWEVADDYATNQKDQESLFELIKQELAVALLKLQQIEAEEAKQEHRRVQGLEEALQEERAKQSLELDFVMNQKDQQSRFELIQKELALLKLEQVEAEESKEEHERVRGLLTEAIRKAEEHEEALQEEQAKLSQVESVLARHKLEHQKAKEAAEEVKLLREQLSVSKQKLEERAEIQKQERSALAGLITEHTQLKREKKKAQAAHGCGEEEKLREQLFEALEKIEGIQEARKEDQMLLAKSTTELSEFQMDQETSVSNINQYAEIVRENDARISSLEVALKSKDLIILEAKGIVEALDSALQAANQRALSQEFDDSQDNCSTDITMYKQQVKVAKRDNEDAQEQIKLLEDLVDNLKVSSSSQEEYGSDMAAVRTELDEAHAQLKLFGKQIQSLRAMNENLEDNGREELARRALVETRIDELENDRISIAAALSEERIINERRASELRDARRQIVVLEDEVDYFDAAEDQQYEETGRAKLENERTKEEVNRLKREHDDVIRSLQKELDAYKMETETAERSLEAALRRVETLEAEIKSSSETHEKLEERLAHENENLRKALEELEQKRNSHIVTIRSELEDSRNELASTATELMEAQLRVRAVERTVDEYDARNQELEQENEKLVKTELQVKGLEKDSAEAAAAYRAESEKKIRLTDDFQLQIGGLKTDFNTREASLKKELSESNAETSASNELLKEAQLDGRRLEREVKTAQESLAQLDDSRDSETKALQTRLSALQHDHVATKLALNQALEAFTSHSEVAGADLDRAETKNRVLQEVVDELEIAHDEIDAVARTLQGEVAEWKAEATKWKEKSENWKEKSVDCEKRDVQLAGGSDPEAPQSVSLQTAADCKKPPTDTAEPQGWGRLGWRIRSRGAPISLSPNCSADTADSQV